MNCNDFMKSARAYVHETLDAAQMEAGRAHESSCKECGDLMRVAREMTCSDFVDFLDDYVSESLPADQRSVFERHIRICPECVAYLESYRTTIALARAVECRNETDMPGSMPEGLVRAVLAARLAAQRPGSAEPDP